MNTYFVYIVLFLIKNKIVVANVAQIQFITIKLCIPQLTVKKIVGNILVVLYFLGIDVWKRGA